MEIDNDIFIIFAQMNIEGYPCASSMTSFLKGSLKVSSTVDAKHLFIRIQWFKFLLFEKVLPKIL